jgi:FAD/FMN-containing dehydrogenase
MTAVSDPTTIEKLSPDLDGRVIAPADADYDKARTVFYGGIDRQPAVIVRPADASHVARIVSAARETGLALAVRSGGHSIAGDSVSEGGIVLDLADMRGLEIDQEARTAWAQTGLTAGEYTNAAAAHGLATGFGDTGAYVNFLSDEGAERVRAAYPDATWDRLTAIKARYDPANLFRLNQNIPPATN